MGERGRKNRIKKSKSLSLGSARITTKREEKGCYIKRRKPNGHMGHRPENATCSSQPESTKFEI